ncbi:hypothetical protein ACTA71_007125 [Dictyostelium dimigraforme]
MTNKKYYKKEKGSKNKIPKVTIRIPQQKPVEEVENFLKNHAIYSKYYYEDIKKLGCQKEIVFTRDFLSLKQIIACQILNIDQKSILKLLRYVIDENDHLSQHYNQKRKIIWPQRNRNSPLMHHVIENDGIIVKCIVK